MWFFKRDVRKSPEDLTSALEKAQSGLRRDVKNLWGALEKSSLLVPLAKRVPGIPLERGVTLQKNTDVIAHLLPDQEQQGRWRSAVFTAKEILASLEEKFGWKTDGKALEYFSMPVRIAFENFLVAAERQQVVGLVINPYHESCLELTPKEVGAVLAGAPIPLLRLVRNTPMRAGEPLFIGQPKIPPPPELVQIVRKYVESHPDLTGYEIFQMFNPERDVEPHLALRLLLKHGEVNCNDIGSEIMLAVRDKIPPPGYIDIMFAPQSSKREADHAVEITSRGFWRRPEPEPGNRQGTGAQRYRVPK